MDCRQEVKSLKKALRALAVMNQRIDATVTDVAREIGVPRTTAFRLLETLAAEGYLEKLDHSDLYRLTSRVRDLASGFGSDSLLVEVAAPLVHDLGRRIGWSVSLATPREDATMLLRLTTNHDTPLALDRHSVGFTTPMLHATTGFCHLAFCPPAERARLVARARQSSDPKQAIARNEARLNAILDRVRRRGFSQLEFPEYREGNVGVPVLLEGRPVAGLVMRYIKTAMREGQLESIFLPQLLALAETIAKRTAERSLMVFTGRTIPAPAHAVLLQ